MGFFEQTTPELRVEILDEFTKEMKERAQGIEDFFRAYNKDPIKAKLERRMKLFEGHSFRWQEVQDVARAMIMLGKATKKGWKQPKRTMTKGQILDSLFKSKNKKQQKALKIIEEKGEDACEYCVYLEQRYLYRIPAKKTCAEALVETYKVWEEFFENIKEKRYRITNQ